MQPGHLRADVAGMEPWRAVLKQAAATKAPVMDAQPKVLDKELGNEVRAPVTQRLALIRNGPLEEYRFAAARASRAARSAPASVLRSTASRSPASRLCR